MNKEDLVVITEVIGEDFNVVTGLYEWGKIDRFIEAFLERMDKNLKFNGYEIIDNEGGIIMNMTDTRSGYDGHFDFLITRVELNKIVVE